MNSAGTAFPMHSDIVMPYISRYGTPEQIEKFIPAMTAGTKVGALAMTEPAAGRYESFRLIIVTSIKYKTNVVVVVVVVVVAG